MNLVLDGDYCAFSAFDEAAQGGVGGNGRGIQWLTWGHGSLHVDHLLSSSRQPTRTGSPLPIHSNTSS